MKPARFAFLALLISLAGWNGAQAAANESVLALAKKEHPALLDTLKELTAIELGSSDLEGLEQIGATLAKRFTLKTAVDAMCSASIAANSVVRAS